MFNYCSLTLDPLCVHPVILEKIDAQCIRSAALRTFGAGGPSRTDAHCWRRQCTSFGNACDDLCRSLALVARRLCSSHVHPDGISALLSCRLIALEKNPGVRPIGISEIPRRIIAKAVVLFNCVLARLLVLRQLFMPSGLLLNLRRHKVCC